MNILFIMNLWKWLFSKKEFEVELDAIKKFQRAFKPTSAAFNNFFIELDKKQKLIDTINFKNFPNFFLS